MTARVMAPMQFKGDVVKAVHTHTPCGGSFHPHTAGPSISKLTPLPVDLAMPISNELKEYYDTYGFVIIPGLLTPSEHTDLLAATDRVVARTRTGPWPHARVVGKQFPPYGVGDDIWGVQHVMHPALEEPIFARWYAGDAVRNAAKMLLGCEDEELQMGGFPSPPKRAFFVTSILFCFFSREIQNCSISS